MLVTCNSVDFRPAGAWIEYMPWWDAIFVDPPTPRDGLLAPSEKPGLGLTLDREALQRYRVR